jgi:RNA polymerase sigma-70 factor (ECF subfamily)
VQGAAPVPDRDLARQRAVVDAFLAAARGGDFDGLLAVLDPDVVLHAEGGAAPAGVMRTVRGARAVAEGALTFSRLAAFARPALVNGAAGLVAVGPSGQLISVVGITVVAGKIVQLDILSDPARLRRLDVSVVEE